jgi:hypothetical protein
MSRRSIAPDGLNKIGFAKDALRQREGARRMAGACD